jgi:hypothetical protein
MRISVVIPSERSESRDLHLLDALGLFNDGTRIVPDVPEETGWLRAGAAIPPPEHQRL